MRGHPSPRPPGRCRVSRKTLGRCRVSRKTPTWGHRPTRRGPASKKTPTWGHLPTRRGPASMKMPTWGHLPTRPMARHGASPWRSQRWGSSERCHLPPADERGAGRTIACTPPRGSQATRQPGGTPWPRGLPPAAGHPPGTRGEEPGPPASGGRSTAAQRTSPRYTTSGTRTPPNIANPQR